MRSHHYLMGLAAGALMVTGAQAADLPAAPEPVDYVRICDAYGSGFYWIPGTDTCLKVAGRIRADYRYQGRDYERNRFRRGWAGVSGNGDDWRFRARAYIRMDSRTSTEYGLLRTYMDVWFTTNESGTNGGGAVAGSGVNLFRAFIQFGGLTAGHTASFFDNGFGTTYWASFAPATSDTDTNLIAYTWAFGNGVSASVSVESGAPNQMSLTQPDLTKPGPLSARPRVALAESAYSGVHWPDLVASVRVDQGWGSAQFGVRAHHNRALAGASNLGAFNTTGTDQWGWAVNAGIEFNIPQMGGARAFVMGTYGRGHVASSRPAWDCEYCMDFFNNRQTRHWSVRGGVSVPFSEQVTGGLDVSYFDHDANGRNRAWDFSRWDVQANIVYRPVSGLQFGFEIDYRNVDSRGNAQPSSSDWVGTFRIQRNFD